MAGCTPTAPPDQPSGAQGGSTPSATGGVPGQGGVAPGTGGYDNFSGGRSGAGGVIPGSGGTTSSPAAGGTPAAGGSPATDAGSTDTPAAPGGACGAKFCDDFEAFAAGAAPAGDWKTSLQKGMLAVDESKAYSGARSVKFTHAGAPARAFIELRQPVLPLPGNIMHGRLMYYLTKMPTGQYTHFELVRGGGPLASGGRAQLNTGGENGKVVINYEPGDCTKYSKVVFPEKKWTCYQWRFDGNKNEMHLTVDKIPVDDVPVAPAGQCWKAPMMMDTVHIGWESYHGAQAVEIWVDDVAVGDQPIPCPTAPPSKP